MKTIFKNGIYVLQTPTLCGEVAVGEDKAYDQTRLWHFRMTHINEQGLKELSKQGILRVGKVTELDKCELCIFGKVKKVKFSKKAIHSSKAPNNPRYPKQNGLLERMNRTLLERVRCMNFHAKLPKSFWGETVAIQSM